MEEAAALPPGPGQPGPAQAVLWGLRYPEFTRAARERFGTTYTIRPGTMGPVVVTTDAGAIRALFTGDPLAKGNANDPVRPLIGERSVILLEPREHLARRKLVLPPFHGDRVRGYAELMRRLMEAEVARWRPGETVAVFPAALNVTIEVILQAVLGVADDDTRQRFRRLIDDLLFYPLGSARLRAGGWLSSRFTPPARVREGAAFVASLPSPAVSTYFPELKVRSRLNFATARWWRHRDRLMELFDEHIAATRSDPRLGEREDVLAMLVQARDEDGRALSTEDLRDDLLTLIGAGHETTAAATAWAAVLLAHEPAVLRRATAAARSGDGDGGGGGGYLGAVVKEVLRIRPPIPVAAGRRLAEPLVIGSHRVPAGTPIVIDAWGVHHDPARYPEPERFRPERFLDGASPESYSWLPFGGGARRCVGAPLAELEIKVALETMLRRVDLEPAEAELVPTARRGITIVPHAGGRVRVAARAG